MSGHDDFCNSTAPAPQVIIEEINLRGVLLRLKHTRVPVSSLDFDPDNPRLRYARNLNPGVSDVDLLFQENDTKWLKADIKEKGLLDPPYVKEGHNGRHVVGEGNRRLACLKSLAEEFPEDPRFLTVQVRVLPPETTEAQLALLMASFHVAGKLQWKAHEKAGHIHHMMNVLKIPEEELKTTLHMGAPAIKRAAESYRVLSETFCKIDDGRYAKEAEGKWSFFAEMMKDKNLRKKHEENPGWAEGFSRWVGERRVPNAEDVRALPDILSQARARHLFETLPVEDAFRLAKAETDSKNPASMSKFYKQLKSLLDTLMMAPYQDVELAGTNETAKVLLQDTHAKLGDFMEKAGVRPMPMARRAA
jgi:hypothetical protein